MAKALREPPDVDPLGGLRVRRAMAAGRSQSASRLHSYVTAVHADADVFDGFFLDGGGSQTFPAEPLNPVIHMREEGWRVRWTRPAADAV